MFNKKDSPPAKSLLEKATEARRKAIQEEQIKAEIELKEVIDKLTDQLSRNGLASTYATLGAGGNQKVLEHFIKQGFEANISLGYLVIQVPKELL